MPVLNFRCRKILYLTPNCLAPRPPVLKMPHLRTELRPNQLPAQKNTLFDTELPGTPPSGAGNAPSAHQTHPDATFGAGKYSFSTELHHATRNGAEK